MFFHIYRYSFKMLIHNRDIMFWTLLFPVLIGTFLYLAVGQSFEVGGKFEPIPTAVVMRSGSGEYGELLRSLSTEQGRSLLNITETTEQEAGKLLREQAVKGIIYVGDSLSLTVLESGEEQSVLWSILDQAEQCRQRSLPWGSGPDIIDKKDIFADNMEPTMNFLYAVIAFACLFTALSGCDRAVKGWGDPLGPGLRRLVSPLQGKGFLGDFLACEVVGYGCVCLVFVYMQLLSGGRMGDCYPAILLLLALGVSCGVAAGMLVGSLPIRKEGPRLAILTSVGLICCAMDDLMVEGIRDSIEHAVPWLNDINPAALISDALYTLNVHDGYGRFWVDAGRLGGETALLFAIWRIIVRRRQYAGV